MFSLRELKLQSIQALNFRQSLGSTTVTSYTDVYRDRNRARFEIELYEKKIQKCMVKNSLKELDQVYREMAGELLKAAMGDFPFIKEMLINLIVSLFRFTESGRESNGEIYGRMEKLFRYESIEALTEEGLKILHSLLMDAQNSFSEGIADKIRMYMNRHLQEDFTLDNLSRSLNYSTAYLSRLIKKSTGQTFSELLQDMRLEKARQLLRETDSKVSSVAQQVGYNDVSYFISVFKKKTGVTPSEYRSLSNLENL